jgi:hypothetical protein
MICNTQKYRVSGLCISSGIPKKKTINTTFRKLDLFQSPGECDTPTLLGPLEKDKLNHYFSTEDG